MTDCGMCETPIEHGYLCPGCTRALADRLHRMPHLYTALEPFLAPGVSGDRTGSRTGRCEAPLPLVENVLDLRGPGGIVGILERWWDALLQDRYMLPPKLYGSIENRLRRAALTLARNTPSIAAEWPAAGPLAREIYDLETAIETITGGTDTPDPGHRLGPCPAEHEDGTLCGAILKLAPGEQYVTCQWCATTYPPATWTALRDLIEHDKVAA